METNDSTSDEWKACSRKSKSKKIRKKVTPLWNDGDGSLIFKSEDDGENEFIIAGVEDTYRRRCDAIDGSKGERILRLSPGSEPVEPLQGVKVILERSLRDSSPREL